MRSRRWPLRALLPSLRGLQATQRLQILRFPCMLLKRRGSWYPVDSLTLPLCCLPRSTWCSRMHLSEAVQFYMHGPGNCRHFTRVNWSLVSLCYCLFCATDLECIFTVICNLVAKVQTPDEALAMADQIGNKLFIQPIDKPTLRLKILFHLYNILGNPWSITDIHSPSS